MIYDFRAALRHLQKNKGFSILNIAGLAVGIAAAALILLWVENEVGYDRSIPVHDRIYRVMLNQVHDGRINTINAGPGPLGPAMAANIPGVRNMARTTNNRNLTALFTLADKQVNEQGNYADSSLFTLLGLQFKYGTAAHAFDEVHSLVISETMAAKFFGDTDPVGKTLVVDNKDAYRIAGVFRDLPANNTIRFQWLAPYALFEQATKWATQWGSNGIATFVELDQQADAGTVNAALGEYLKTKQDWTVQKAMLFPMNDWHLYWHFENGHEDGKGQIIYVRLFSVIAAIILVIACINFMNLSTAKSIERAREVGVRKVIGAVRGELIRQFIGESLTYAFLAVVLAVLLVLMAREGFAAMVGENIPLRLFSPVHLGALAAIGLVTGLLAGSYPAFYLSSFPAVAVLKRLKGAAGAALIRRGLVVLQFTISILLIICTVVIYQQVEYTNQRDWGFERENLLLMKVQGVMQSHFPALRQDLIRTGVVDNAALSMSNIMQLGWWDTDEYDWPGKQKDKNVMISNEQVTASYIPTTGMKIVAGRNFESDTHAEDNNIIINETLARAIGSYARPGNYISQGDRQLRIVGIMHDYIFDNIYGATPPPLVFYAAPDNANFMTIRLRRGVNVGDALAAVSGVLKVDNPGYPVDYRFVNDDFDQLFKAELLTGRLSGIFAALAILISCLGLFGLSAYSAAQRSKEISIRKVLGASTGRLATLLSGDFLRWVGVACVLAFPLGWWFMNGWLRDYEYRTAIHWWVFGLAGLGAMLIALATVSYQAIRTAMASPTRALRSE